MKTVVFLLTNPIVKVARASSSKDGEQVAAGEEAMPERAEPVEPSAPSKPLSNLHKSRWEFVDWL